MRGTTKRKFVWPSQIIIVVFARHRKWPFCCHTFRFCVIFVRIRLFVEQNNSLPTTQPVSSLTFSSRNKLVFTRYGSNVFLFTIVIFSNINVISYKLVPLGSYTTKRLRSHFWEVRKSHMKIFQFHLDWGQVTKEAREQQECFWSCVMERITWHSDICLYISGLTRMNIFWAFQGHIIAKFGS